MSFNFPSFEDWLKKEHPEIDADERAKLVEEETNLRREEEKDFDFLSKMSTRRANLVYEALIEKQLAKLSDRGLSFHFEYNAEIARYAPTSRHEFVEMLANAYANSSGISREEAVEKVEQMLAAPSVKDNDDVQ
jgi:hypothetical protein